MAQNRMTVALLFGGRSSEHSVSCATAAGVLAAIDRERFDVVPVGITREGAFVLADDDSEEYALREGRLSDVIDNGTRIVWPDRAGSRTLAFTDSSGRRQASFDVDVVFPLLHGTGGEDGAIQGLLETFSLPYVGSGILGSATGLDKHVTKTMARAVGVAVAPWVAVTEEEWCRDPVAVADRVAKLGLPAFVKPVHGGSSVGVTRVSAAEGLGDALALAFGEESRVVVEAALTGRELEIGVLGARPGARPRVSVAGEVVMSGGGFYDFEAKYLAADEARTLCPAPLSAEQLADMQDLAVRVFEAISGSDLARVDFFLTEDGFVLNEINTMPGFTPISMFPQCWEASGVGYTQLISELIDLAVSS